MKFLNFVCFFAMDFLGEDGNMIESGNDNEAIMFDVVRLKNKGIKYTDLANSIKNQFDYNIKLNKAIQAYNGKMDMKMV